MRRVAIGPVALVALGALAGCGRAPVVTRVYDGHVVHGRYVPPEAYAAFLRGVLAEESGDLAGAKAAYEEALDEDDDDPLLLARLGEVACRQGGAAGNRLATRSFARAKELDPAYAGVLAAEARCALVRKDPASVDRAAQAAAADPKNGEIAALVVRAEATRPASPEARARAIALTRTHGERVSAWEALLAWGRAHGDDALVAEGLAGLGRLAPLRGREVESGALDLLARDRPDLARVVAAALADAPRERGHTGPRDPVVARLAVDEAIVRGDGESARSRATRGHVPLAEVAARAVALDKSAIGSALAEELASADPNAVGPRLVLAALASKVTAPAASAEERAPALCVYVFADRFAASAGVEAARAWISGVTYTTPPARDPVAAALADALAKRGVLPAAGAAEPRSDRSWRGPDGGGEGGAHTSSMPRSGRRASARGSLGG